MSDEKRYNVTIGLSIVKAGTPAYADFGLRYANMKYDDVVEIERIVSANATTLQQGLEPILKELIAMGYSKAEVRKAEAAKVEATPNAYPGTMR